MEEGGYIDGGPAIPFRCPLNYLLSMGRWRGITPSTYPKDFGKIR
jgi:hypothetical protein